MAWRVVVGQLLVAQRTGNSPLKNLTFVMPRGVTLVLH
jgi:hypothetical protein